MGIPHRTVLACLAALSCLPASAAGSWAGVQPDGTVVVLESLAPDNRAIVVAAFRPDGEKETGYGADGALRVHGSGVEPALAVLPDGRARVLTTGPSGCRQEPIESSCYGAFVLERLGAAGEREGRVVTRETGVLGLDYTGVALAAAGDGLLELSHDEQRVVRRDAEGFALAGSNFSDSERYVSDVVAAGDGAAVFADDEVGRLDAALNPVESFGEQGWVTPPIHVAAVVADGDGLLLAGFEDGARVARLLADGSPDPDFGDGGVAALPSAMAGVTAIAVAPDGTVTAGGTKGGDFVIARLTPSGEPDPAFGGGDGVTVVDLGGEDRLREVLLAGDGEVTATGLTVATDGARRIALARLTAAGELDPDFGEGGRVTATADVTAPVITIDEAPAEGALVDAGSVRVAVSSDDPAARLICNGRDCDEPVTFEDIRAGGFELDVMAEDAGGNQGFLTRRFEVAPRTRPLGGPPALSREPTASFTWESANPPTPVRDGNQPAYRCRLDGGGWTACQSGHAPTGLADGEHTFEVQQSVQRYHYGEERLFEVEPERWTWTVDTKPQEPVKPEEPVPPPPGGGGPGPGTPLVPEPPVFVPPTLEQQRAAAQAGLKTSVKRSGRLRGAKAVSLDVGSAVKAAARVSGSVRMAGRRQAIALRPFSGQVETGRSVRAKLRLSKAARALLRRRGGPRTVVVRLKVTLADSGGRSLATRSVRVRLRR